jgi:hypothetical protein
MILTKNLEFSPFHSENLYILSLKWLVSSIINLKTRKNSFCNQFLDDES